MSTTEFFDSPQCPRCGQETLLRVGETHYLVVPLLYEEAAEAKRGPDLTCYAKACSNCGYAEFFAKPLIDQFNQKKNAVPSFGEITRGPDGQYLVSIFKEYSHRGVRASDFTVPLTPEQWFALSLVADSGSDEQVLDLVLDGPYRKAWLDRIGPVPADMGAQLRVMVRRFLQQQRLAGRAG